jgi:ketosteroid isomerase-like protein
MPMSQSNVQTVAAAIAAFNAGDLSAARPLTHPDFTYIIRGRGPFAGRYQGVDAVIAVLQAIRAATSQTMTAEPEVIVSGGDHVMAYMRVHGSRPDGRTYDHHQAYLYRLAAERLIEGQSIPVDQYAFDEFTRD